METKHTPGPWEQGTQTRGSTTLVAQIETGFAVAEMRNVHFREEAEANARLIAAAPDLLTELRQAISQMEMAAECIEAGRLNEALLHVSSLMHTKKAAIAKAIGKTP